MDIHKNARLTPFSREALAQRILGKQQTLKAAAAAFNVCPKTAAKWVRRYRQAGREGMADHSSPTPPSLHPSLYPAHQRQGRTFHSNRSARMGLRLRLLFFSPT